MKQLFHIQIIGLLVLFSVQSCQSEKFAEKGIPEVKTVSVTILEDGVTFHGEILSSGGKTINEMGFTWNKADTPGEAEYVFLDPVEGKVDFSATVNSTIEKNEMYSLRAFIVTDEITSYGNEIIFTGKGSKPSVLNSVSPGSAVCGDTVLIKGEYFSYNLSTCSVYFNNTAAEVISSTMVELRVRVPFTGQSSLKIRAEIAGINSSNELDFSIIEPLLLGFTPQSGTFNDIVTLTGANFPVDTSSFGIYFNNAKAEVSEAARTYYKVKVPTGNIVSPATIKIKYLNDYTYPVRFVLDQAVINDITPAIIFSDETITISGQNFNPDAQMNTVEIGGSTAHVTDATSDELIINPPSDLANGLYQVTVTTIEGLPVTSAESIEFRRPEWVQLADFPGVGRWGSASFVVDGKGYLVTGIGDSQVPMNDFWKYDPSSGQWSALNNFPVSLVYLTGFSINNTGYVTLGKYLSSYSVTLRRYNAATDTWTTLQSIPGPGSSMDSPGFVIDGKAYVPSAGEMYEFDPSMNSWTRKSYPSSALGYFGGGVTFSINGKGYLGIGWHHEIYSDVTDFFEYDPDTDTWSKRSSFPGTPRDNATSFTLPDGKGYVCFGYSNSEGRYLNDMWEYDPVYDQWTRLDDFPGTPRCASEAFVIGESVYLVGGKTVSGDGKEFWRFTTNR